MPGLTLEEQLLGVVAVLIGLYFLYRFVDKAADRKIERIMQARRANMLNQVLDEHYLRQAVRIRMLEKLLEMRSQDWEDQS